MKLLILLTKKKKTDVSRHMQGLKLQLFMTEYDGF